ncbi:MAG: FAD-dependent oxidoreductase [Tissierellia bacterium]|nr:FAD-dependent oxidoreductase [Tissierellia bacterium]
MLLLRNIKLPYNHSQEDLRIKIEESLNKKIDSYEIYKKSIDARHGVYYIYQVLVDTKVDNKIKKRLRNNLADYHEENLSITNKNKVESAVIIGAGPSGLLAAYTLAQAGVRVDIIEQGQKMEARVKSVDEFIKGSSLNLQSNIQFGEGGAGTFSDGKLTSRSKDKRIREIYRILVENGANEDILYDHLPHIGTDILRKVIVNIRKKIISLGGTFHFDEKFIDLNIKSGKLISLITDKDEYKADEYILALGNSSRDTFIMLDKYLSISSKPFAVGFRIEHLQDDINYSQYKIRDDKLPQASYQLNYSNKELGRSVYTFCMCPGGYVVNGSSEKDRLCVNGMSYHDRSNVNSNSAIVAAIDSKIYGSGNLDGIYFQREIERKAYNLAGANNKAPVQRLEDYILDRPTKNLGKIKPSVQTGFTLENLNGLYPEPINLAIKEALKIFDKRLKGFADPDALLTGVETRTSSPIRIERKNYSSRFKNLRPIGEGAGYAGGIISSSLDGLKCALEILEGSNQ